MLPFSGFFRFFSSVGQPRKTIKSRNNRRTEELYIKSGVEKMVFKVLVFDF